MSAWVVVGRVAVFLVAFVLGVASLLDDGLNAVRLGEGGAWEGFGRVAGVALSGFLAYLAITGGLS